MSRALRQAVAGLICAAALLGGTVVYMWTGEPWAALRWLAMGAVIAAFIQPD